jgi:hypothetical protein
VKAATKATGGRALTRWLIGKMLPARKKQFMRSLQAFKMAVERDAAEQDAAPTGKFPSEEQIAHAAMEEAVTAADPPSEKGES